MSRITFTFTMFVVVASIIAGLFACSMSTAEAATRGYVVSGSDSTAKSHQSADAAVATSITWGSDDADYSKAQAAPVSTFATFVNAVSSIFSLPNTAAPHGSVTCTMTDSNGHTFTVTRDSCDDL